MNNEVSLQNLELSLTEAIKEEKTHWLNQAVQAMNAYSSTDKYGDVKIVDNLFYQNIRSLVCKLLSHRPTALVNNTSNSDATSTAIIESVITNQIKSHNGGYNDAKRAQAQEVGVVGRGVMLATMDSELFTTGGGDVERKYIRWSHLPFNRVFLSSAAKLADVSRVWVVNAMRKGDIERIYEIESDELEAFDFTKPEKYYNVVDCYDRDVGMIHSFITTYDFRPISIENHYIKCESKSMLIKSSPFPEWFNVIKSPIPGLPFSIMNTETYSGTIYPIVQFSYYKRIFNNYNACLGTINALNSGLKGVGIISVQSNLAQEVISAYQSANVGDVIGVPFDANQSADTRALEYPDTSSVINQAQFLQQYSDWLAQKISAYNGVNNEAQNNQLTQANASNAQIYAIQSLADERFGIIYNAYLKSVNDELHTVFNIVKTLEPKDVLTDFTEDNLQKYSSITQADWAGIGLEITTTDENAVDNEDKVELNQNIITQFFSTIQQPAWNTLPNNVKVGLIGMLLSGTGAEKSLQPIISQWLVSPDALAAQQQQNEEAKKQADLQSEAIASQTKLNSQLADAEALKAEVKAQSDGGKQALDLVKTEAEIANINAKTEQIKHGE